MAENEMRRIRPRRRAHRERSGSASLTDLSEAEESQAGEEQRDRLAGDPERENVLEYRETQGLRWHRRVRDRDQQEHERSHCSTHLTFPPRLRDDRRRQMAIWTP